MKKKTSISLFASGNGSNVKNIIAFFNLNNTITVGSILCNNPKAKVIEYAKNDLDKIELVDIKEIEEGFKQKSKEFKEQGSKIYRKV